MKRRTRTLLIIIGVVVLLAVVIVLNLRKSDSGEPVETTKVEYGSILSRVSATGELKAKAQVNLQAQVMGIVSRLAVQEGDRVKKGDVLLELEQQAYQAQLVQARAGFTQASLSHARVESLYARKLISDQEYEASKAAFDMARAQYDAAQDQFERTTIRAPISGTVVKVNVKEGETVIIGTMNAIGTVIMVLADMSQMEAWVDVDETDVVSLELGQPAKVEVDALPDTSFSGHVTRIGYMPTQNVLSTETQGTDFEVVVTLDSTAPMLRPGMSVSADITTASLDSVLVIPIQSVGRRQVGDKDEETVFVVEGGKAVLRTVKTGKVGDNDVQVLDGLKPDEEVITGPYKVLSKLKEGRRVKPGTADRAPTFKKTDKKASDK